MYKPRFDILLPIILYEKCTVKKQIVTLAIQNRTDNLASRSARDRKAGLRGRLYIPYSPSGSVQLLQLFDHRRFQLLQKHRFRAAPLLSETVILQILTFFQKTGKHFPVSPIPFNVLLDSVMQFPFFFTFRSFFHSESNILSICDPKADRSIFLYRQFTIFYFPN